MFDGKKLLMPKLYGFARFWKLAVCLRWIALSFHNRYVGEKTPCLGKIIEENLQKLKPCQYINFQLT